MCAKKNNRAYTGRENAAEGKLSRKEYCLDGDQGMTVGGNNEWILVEGVDGRG
jgi:hypothetical protein